MLFNVYTPTSRNNLVAGLFARSDENNYGEMLLFRLPKQRIVYGPEQVEALISQDPVISQQISLWSRQKSQVIQGNLLVIPYHTNSGFPDKMLDKVHKLKSDDKYSGNLRYIKSFLEKYNSKFQEWGKECIEERSRNLAEEAFDSIWYF